MIQLSLTLIRFTLNDLDLKRDHNVNLGCTVKELTKDDSAELRATSFSALLKLFETA